MLKYFKSIILVLLMISLPLSGCGGTSTKSSNSNNRSSSERTKVKSDTFPSKPAMKLAAKRANNYDDIQLANSANKDSSIRYSDIIGSKDRSKYAGRVKLIAGEVVSVEKTNSQSSFMYYISDDANPKHIFALWTNKKHVRTKDQLQVKGVIAGKMSYSNTNNTRVDAVMLVADKQNVQNYGASGE